MIKFFRHIRRSLINQNKMGKYFKYAIGEILLVVIGILIALQINIWNQEKNNEQKVINTLKQIQKDLLNDLQEAQYFSDSWERDDKMLTHFFKASKPEKYFRDNISDFAFIGLTTHRFVQNKQGYNRLNEQIEIVPPKYDDVLNKLSRLYNERSTYLFENQDVFNAQVQDYRNYLYDNVEWMENFDINNEEVFNYYYSSNKHRKSLVKIRANLNRYNNQFSVVKDQSLLCYLAIRAIINDRSEYPNIIKSFGLEYSNNNIEDFIGSYGFKSDSLALNFMEIKYNVLFWSSPNQRELYTEGFILREYGKDSLGFVSSNIYPMKFIRDANNKVTGFKGFNSNDSTDGVEAIKLD
ncbi:DUF6090 family protein [Ichthyenterobacterium sp. W332]|uniref:DUF6090 family protein n=1 Tax=Microcosmobacter mediterraneus TaxID=3075607 RepID=A0ABU2YJE5_9FLAO|nr:DUF6090 family protein [Ichthyenterobacterium sp. W332]MDT0558293.1 DUF6090 family protein [Ichthyenterobacterium sp. W332]